MKKVAVCIHGELRHWDITSKIFNLWNKTFDDITFEFYLATWHNHNNKDLQKNITLKNYKEYTHEDMYINMSSPLSYYFKNIKIAREVPSYQHYYTFLLSKSVDLLKEADDNDYQAVILIRPDIFAGYDVLRFIDDKFKFREPNENINTVAFGDNIVYSESGSNYTQNRLFCNKDTLFIGSKNGILKFGEIFNDIFIKGKFPPIHLHGLQGEYLNWKRIHNKKHSNLRNELIRYKNNVKPGRPTPEGLQECLETFAEDLYKPENTENIYNIFLKNSKDKII